MIRDQLRRREIHLAVQAVDQPDFDSVVHLARTAERGLFDFIVHAELTVLSALAAVTERLGLVGAVDTRVTKPFEAARQLATLDHLSNGRAGWVVDHGEPSHRATEFITVVHAFWDSWQPGAVLADATSGVYADADRIRSVEHHGSHFDVRGPATLPARSQGHPVLLQVGGDSADARNAQSRKVFITAGLEQFVGTAAEVAAEIELRVQSGATCDGLLLVPPPVPHGLDGFVDSVVPLLQQEGGVFREAYDGTTLREHLRP